MPKLPAVMELCYVTADIDKAMQHYTSTFGAGPFFLLDLTTLPGGQAPALPIKMAFAYSGTMLIELVEPVGSTPSIFREVLDVRGESYHHVMLRIDYDEGEAMMKARGYAVGVKDVLPTGERFALYDARRDSGGFIEIMDLSPGFLGMIGRMEQAHRDWDGVTDPVRSLFAVMS